MSGTVIVEGREGPRGKGASRLDRLLEAKPQDFQQLGGATARSCRRCWTRPGRPPRRRLNDLLVEGRKLVTFLRGGVKQRYGGKSEKLAELDLAPVRPKAKPSTDAAKPPAPPTPTSSHPTTA